MSWDIKTIYLWKPVGSRTCSVCLSMPKWSDDEPVKPHPYCDCEISMYSGIATEKFKNIKETSGGGAVRMEKQLTEIYNPGTKPMAYTKTFSISLKSTTQVKISSVAKELGMEVSGSSETTRTWADSVPVSIPPKKRLILEIKIESLERIYTADKYYVFPVLDFDGYTKDWEEMFVGTVEGVRVIDEWGHVSVTPRFENSP